MMGKVDILKNLECFCDKDVKISLVSGNVMECNIVCETYDGEKVVDVEDKNGMRHRIHANEIKMIEVM